MMRNFRVGVGREARYIICDKRSELFIHMELRDDRNARIIHLPKENAYLVYPSLGSITDGKELGTILYGLHCLILNCRERAKDYDSLSDTHKKIVTKAFENLRNKVPTWDEYLKRNAGIKEDRQKTNGDWLEIICENRSYR